MRNGHFLDLESLEWTTHQAPYLNDEFDNNSLFTYQGKPTIFGAPETCGGNPQKTTVLQYDGLADDWSAIGYMQGSRKAHEVIPIPASFCNYYE